MLSKIRDLFGKPKLDTFIGLIDENGFAKMSQGGTASLGFSFCAYSKNGSELIQEEIYVRKEIPHIDHEIPGLGASVIVKIQGEETLYHGQRRILLKSIMATDVSHPNLEVLREERQQAVIYQSEDFGSCILDRAYRWFECQHRWMGTEVDLYFNTDQLSEMEDLEKIALELYAKEKSWDQKIKQKIVEGLLPLKNDTWLEEDEKPLTAAEFKSKIQIETINILTEGEFEFWYQDGDIFFGHSISIEGKLDGSLKNAGIQG